MARNKIEDLRNHLFAQLERLGDETLKGDALKKEVERADSIAQISSEIIESAKVEVAMLRALGATSTDSQFFKDTAKQIG